MKSAATSLFALLLSTTTLAAENVSLPEVLSILDQQGYTDIEVSREAGRLKIEAEGPGTSRELVYDTQTGEILVDESSWDDDHDENDDDSRVAGRDDDDHDDDRDDDHDDDDDDDDDDDSSDDHGGDDDSGDDRDDD